MDGVRRDFVRKCSIKTTTKTHLAVSTRALIIAAVFAGAIGCPASATDNTGRAMDAGTNDVPTTNRDVSRDAVHDGPNFPEDPDRAHRPRLISPLSTTYTTHRRPTLRWEPPASASNFRVDVCRDRDCRFVEESIEASGNSARPTRDLPQGVHFWRVLALEVGGAAVSSYVWEFSAPPTSASHDSSFGFYSDVNGDGLGDVVVTEAATSIAVYLGGVSGFGVEPFQRLHFDRGVAYYLARAGDINGDGFTDYSLAANSGDNPTIELAGPTILYGSPQGLQDYGVRVLGASPQTSLGVQAQPVGDWNGDGYTDFAAGLEVVFHHLADAWLGDVIYIVGGARSGVTPQIIASVPRALVESSDLYGTNFMAPGDVDGDGVGDLIAMTSVSDNNQSPLRYSAAVFHGAIPIGPPIARIGSPILQYPRLFTGEYMARHAPCDLDGDGMADILATLRGRDAYHLAVFRSSSLTDQWEPELNSEPLGFRQAPWITCGPSMDGVHVSTVLVQQDLGTLVGVADRNSVRWTDVTAALSRSFPTDVENILLQENLVSVGSDFDNDGRADIFVHFVRVNRGLIVSGESLLSGSAAPSNYPLALIWRTAISNN